MRSTALLGVILAAATAAISACDGRGETPATGLFVVARDGSGLTRLADDARPVWSPDGRRIAFAAPEPCILCGPSDVYVVAADGGKVERLTEGSGEPAWSPDGAKIAFVHWPLGIFVVNVDRRDSSKEPLPEFLAVGAAPAWSPDGQRIAFTRGRPGDIWVIRFDGTGARRLTRNPGGEQFAWSPDGTRIAFSSAKGIYVVNPDGTRLHHVTRGLGGFPVWSPDGTRIAFSSAKRIYVVKAGGSGLRKLSKGHEPAWSPDGKEIAFAYYGERCRTTCIFVQNVESHQLRRLTMTPDHGHEDLAPTWSPDGTRIAFARGVIEALP